MAVGAKGAGTAIKAVKGGSMGSKAAKVAGIVEKYANIVKSAGNTLKQWTLQKLPNAIKGIFGKKKPPPELPVNATNKQKGNFGEIMSRDNMLENKALREKGYDLERIGNDAPKGLDDKIKKGIDGIYENKTSPPKYVIDEAKFGDSQLSKTPKDGPQMSDDWIKGSNRIEKQFPDTPEGRRQAAAVRDAWDEGQVEKVVSKIDETGKVTRYRVDEKGNIGSIWP